MRHLWRYGISLVIVDHGRGFPVQAETSLHGFQQLTHSGAVDGDFDLDAPVAFEVDDGEGLARFVEGVLRDVLGALMAFGAQSAALAVRFVGVGAGCAVRAVAGECFHDEELVVVGEAGVGCWYGREADLAGAGRHDWFGEYG